MKINLVSLFTCAAIAVLSLPILSAYAENNGTEQPIFSHDGEGGGFLKIGAGYLNKSTPYGDKNTGYETFFSARYQFENGLYGEFSNGANEINSGRSIGYNFLNTEKWNFDLSIMQGHGASTIAYIFESNEQITSESSKNKIKLELGETYMLGLRATGKFDDTLVQFIAAPYSFNNDYDDAYYASAWLSEEWQLRNWQLHSSVGVTYRSAGMINHYYNLNVRVDSEPALPKLDDSLNVTAQIGASYSFAENWLFESYYRYTKLSDSIIDSPVIQLKDPVSGSVDHESEFALSVSYVF